MPATGCSVRRITSGARMADNKTQPTKASVTEFIKAIDDPQKRADART